MSTWNELLAELGARTTPSGSPDYDGFRRAKMQAVKDITKRDLLVYATDFLSPMKVQATNGDVSISMQDKEGFRELVRSVNANEVDILLFSPGGSPEAAEGIVEMLRSKFQSIRFFVPMAAKSAATMIALAGDEILLDETGELGPTDPQMVVTRDGQTVRVPAGAALEQFAEASRVLSKDSSQIPVWLPILRQYGPSFLKECEAAIGLSEELVSRWLETYMFAGESDGASKAHDVAKHLADRANFKSHSRRVGLDALRALGVKARGLQETQDLQDAVWDLQYAIGFTFNGTGAYKIFESTGGAALIRLVRQVELVPGPHPQQPAKVPSSPGAGPGPSPTRPNRAARRGSKKK